MRPLLTRAGLVAALCWTAGCSSPPSSTSGGESFAWRVAVKDLDQAVLATCVAGSDLWAVGGGRDTGMALTWTGADWQAAELPAGAGVLWWCWADSTGAVWAVGERGTVLRHQHGVWSRHETHGAVPREVALFGVWGTAADDVWVVGGSVDGTGVPAAIAHYDGQAWTPIDTGDLPPHPLFKIWGTATDDVWAVGGEGTALHYDGSEWTAASTPTRARLIAVWGAAPDDVYAVGGLAAGVVLRFDGSEWSLLAETPEALAGVWTAPDQPLYVGGNRGYSMRMGREPGGRVDATTRAVTLPVDDLCIHSLAGVHGTGPRHAVVAAAADLFGGSAGSWRGTLLVHGDVQLDGPVRWPDIPDAPDAGTVADAGPAADAAPGPGEPCGELPWVCAPGLECWLLLESNEYLCTQPCEQPDECSAYGDGACCARPGFQTLETVCIPGSYAACSPAERGTPARADHAGQRR